MKQILSYSWKLPLCGIAFFLGMTISGMALPMLGFRPPEMPVGTDPNTIAVWFMLGSMILSLALSFLSRYLHVNWFARWIILAELTWVFGAVGMVLESFFFMTTGAVSSIRNALFTLLNFLLPCLFMAGAVTVLFRPVRTDAWHLSLDRFLGSRAKPVLVWRSSAAILGYPLIYFTFGLIVQPFIQEYYALGQYELTTPTWGQLIPLQIFRSCMFLLVSLPVVIWWNGSRRGLWLALGFSIFVLTAFMAVITAYWFPWQMRLFHGLELLADGLVYAGVLVLLFGREQRQSKNEAKNVLKESFAGQTQLHHLQEGTRIR